MTGIARAGLWLGLLVAAGSVTGLVATGLVVWRRTARLRSPGHDAVHLAEPPVASGPSSRTTWIAAAGGGGLALAGVAMLVGRVWSGVLGVAVALAGAVVIASGVRDRVVELAADEQALLVRRARRSATRLAWSEILGLHVPRTPLGGWRIRAVDGSASLMPSDVLGREEALEAVVVRACLLRSGRAWVRVEQWP